MLFNDADKKSRNFHFVLQQSGCQIDIWCCHLWANLFNNWLKIKGIRIEHLLRIKMALRFCNIIIYYIYKKIFMVRFYNIFNGCLLEDCCFEIAVLQIFGAISFPTNVQLWEDQFLPNFKFWHLCAITLSYDICNIFRRMLLNTFEGAVEF